MGAVGGIRAAASITTVPVAAVPAVPAEAVALRTMTAPAAEGSADPAGPVARRPAGQRPAGPGPAGQHPAEQRPAVPRPVAPSAGHRPRRCVVRSDSRRRWALAVVVAGMGMTSGFACVASWVRRVISSKGTGAGLRAGLLRPRTTTRSRGREPLADATSEGTVVGTGWRLRALDFWLATRVRTLGLHRCGSVSSGNTLALLGNFGCRGRLCLWPASTPLLRCLIPACARRLGLIGSVLGNGCLVHPFTPPFICHLRLSQRLNQLDVPSLGFACTRAG